MGGSQDARGGGPASRLAVSGIVLAGGRSRRMGRDKRSLPIGGRPMLAVAVDLLASIAD
jgi:molybdopterin-guanine dinucleotide biosynthesis protein A